MSLEVKRADTVLAENVALALSSGVTIGSELKQAAITNASTSHNLNAAFSDTEAETALDALGTKINSILAALRTANIIAS